MSDLKIKVGLELDDDIKELIHKEIKKQLVEKSTYSTITFGDNYVRSEVTKYGKSSKVILAPESTITFKIENNLDEKLKELETNMLALQSKITTLMRE